MDVRLPDGTIVRNVPEGTTRAQLMSKLRAGGYDVSGFEEPEERTFGGYAKEALKGLVPGAIGLGETAITGAASLLPEEAEEAIRRPVEEFAAGVRERFAPAPGYEDTTVRKLSEAVGSTVPFLPLGALGAAGRIAATGLGVSAGAGEARQRAEEEEATEGERAVATALGAPVGALEALPPIRILRRFGFGDEAIEEVAGFAPALRRAAQAGGEEALQEASSQVLQNLIAKGVYAPDEAVFGGVGEAAALGGGAGAVVSAIADLALGRRLRGPRGEEEAAPAEEAPPVEEITPTEEEPLALPAPRTAGYKVDSQGNVVPMTEAEAEEGARISSEFRALGLGEAEALAARMQEGRRRSEEAELRRRPLGEEDQMGLPLEGGEAVPSEFGPTITPPEPIYRPAEDVLADLKPRSRAYKEEAKSLGLKLDRKGNVKPNQFIFEQPEAREYKLIYTDADGSEVSELFGTSEAQQEAYDELVASGIPAKNIVKKLEEAPLTQSRFEFEVSQEQPDLPMYVPPTEGQTDMFDTPMPRGGEMPTVPTAAEMPVVEEVPKEQMALNLPGIPMESLAPRDRVLRAMSISEDRKTVDNLKFATMLPRAELREVLGTLKNEGAIAYKPGKFEWELTPEGAERVRSGTETKPPSRRRGPALSVPPQGAAESGTAPTGERGVAGAGETATRVDAGEGAGEAPLEAVQGATERAISESDFYQRRLGIIKNAQQRLILKQLENRKNEFRSQAIDAFEKGTINDTTYNSIMGELKKPTPNLAFVANKLTARAKPVAQAKPAPAPVKQAPSIGLSENATDEEIAAYYKKTGGSKAPPVVKKERGISFAEMDREAEDAADAFLRAAEEKAAPAPTPAPKAHPEWATKFEPDVGGEVVYSDDDAALVRGSSVLSGQNVYMAVDRKTGSRTRVDIDSFTGSLFSPEQKQRLVQVKKQIVARDSELLAQNPDGPFTGATSNVVASEKVNPNYTNFLSSLMKSMGLGDVRVFLVHPEDVRNQADKYKLYGDYSSAMSAGLDAGEEGSLRAYGPNRKDFYISLKSGLSEGRSVEIVAHELGHLIEKVAYNNASPETKAAIRAEYEAWLKETQGKKGSDLIRALRNRETAEAQAEGKTPETKLAAENSYWRSFSEWFADNTSKWATTSEKPVGIVEKFFSDLAKKLREFVAKLTGNRFVPAKSVKDFLDAMGPGSADAWKSAKNPLAGTPFDDGARYSMTPTEQRDNDRRFINSVGKIPQNLPAITKDTYNNAVDAASKMPSSMRQGLYSMLNLHELDRMYGKYTNALGNWWKDVNREGVALRKQQEVIEKNFQKWQKVMEPYSDAERDRIYKLFMDTTVDQVEVLDLVDPSKNINWVAKKDSSLYRQFSNLKPEVKEFYKELRLSYMDYSLQTEKLLQQYLTPNEWQKMLNEFNKRRLPVYLPLFRKGDYKLTYTDKDGEYVARQFETPNQRKLARLEAQRSGAKEFKESTIGAKEFDTLPSAGFFGKVVATLTEKGVDNDTQRAIVDLYLDYLPTNSVLQLSRRREGTAGFSSNVLEAYANVADSYSRRLVNMEYMPKFNQHNEDLKADLMSAVDQNRLDSVVAGDLLSIADRQLDYIRNPNMNNLAAKVGYFSYQMYLGANISTAIVNTLDIPTITWSRLGGKYGFGKAFNSITKAATTFFSNQKSPEMEMLIEQGLNSGVLREQQLQDLAEFKDIGSKYLQMKGRVERLTNWAFAKSDIFNRQVTLAAAYDLAKKTPEGVFDEKAFEQAQRAVYDVYGSSFPKAGPPIMGNQLARTALTFKRFAITRMNLLVNAMREARDIEPDPAVRDAARKELLGYFGTAYVFAGVQGMPLVGAGMALASALNGIFGDDDEPYNPDFALREAVNLFNYKGPVNYLLGVDIASRTGWTGMFWREDPKRMAEVGPVTYVVEQLLGPAYSYAVGVPRAFDYMENGQYNRAFEQLAPRFMGNVVKGLRYAEEGAVTASGKPLVKDVNAYNVFMQVFGFRPSEIAEAGDIAGAAKRAESVVLKRRSAIIARAALARLSGDMDGFEEARQEAVAFNQRNPELPITGDTLIQAVERRKRNLLQSVNGVNVNPKLARRIYSELGIEEESE